MDAAAEGQEAEPTKVQGPPRIQGLYRDLGKDEWAVATPEKVETDCSMYSASLPAVQALDAEEQGEFADPSRPDAEHKTTGDSRIKAEPETLGGVKEPLPSRAQTPEHPDKGEEERRPCVQALFPDVWDRPVDFNLLASHVCEKLSPGCCYRCGLVVLFQKDSCRDYTPSIDVTGLSVMEVKGADLCKFLELKLAEHAEKQIRHGDKETQGEHEEPEGVSPKNYTEL
ncbi:uncharacterized protein LOC129333716 [Eublepharis macularius]|uniref:Uncharacterized protein LOC129325232 n=1 Tax=Eublepharis macularius TaxID=481883 RepID=A0AA97J017_EUBMA|nr:uncharacterized protein LOC129325232 [Eublepharis macularius]XP_054828833.1 uncharacterized protein LOC129325235 [Eublepharis macularius]XP_054841540.1 uncharacterized protein LOC129333715 [Eublepharis macularius]XP_054841541.1 uncharacterized protein LOC129333716 [Eublepharis macularius]